MKTDVKQKVEKIVVCMGKNHYFFSNGNCCSTSDLKLLQKHSEFNVQEFEKDNKDTIRKAVNFFCFFFSQLIC
jgi:hypothetical protein